MRIPVTITALIAVAAFVTPYGLQYTEIPKFFAPVALKDPLTAEQLASLFADLAKTEDDLTQAQATAGKHGDTLVGALASARVQQLLLTHAMIDNRLRAARGEAALVAAVRMITPDPLRASKIRDEIKVVEIELAAATAQAKLYSGGLVLAMIISREETAKLQLAQLKSGLYEAELGVAMTATGLKSELPSIVATDADAQITAPVTSTSDVSVVEAVEPVPPVMERPIWADTNFPDIDYTDDTFASLAKEGMKMLGWWAVSEVKAPVDDSLAVSGINVSAVKRGSLHGDMTLIARCHEGETAIIFNADTYLMSDYDRYKLPTVYRIDDKPSVTTNWGTLTSNQGVGLFGGDAIKFLTQIEGAKKLFVRVTEKNGQNHDALFMLDGLAAVTGRVKLACGW
jgi:hypothetical protein